jgi:hypothetical protein
MLGNMAFHLWVGRISVGSGMLKVYGLPTYGKFNPNLANAELRFAPVVISDSFSNDRH